MNRARRWGRLWSCQDLLHQVAVKDRPRAGVFRGMRLQEGGQLFRHGMRARAGLAGNRHGAPRAPSSREASPLPAGCIWQLMNDSARSKPGCAFIILRGSSSSLTGLRTGHPILLSKPSTVCPLRATVILRGRWRPNQPCSFSRHPVWKACNRWQAMNRRLEAYQAVPVRRSPVLRAEKARNRKGLTSANHKFPFISRGSGPAAVGRPAHSCPAVGSVYAWAEF